MNLDKFVIKESQVSTVILSAHQGRAINNIADNEDVPTDNTNVEMDNNGDNILGSSIVVLHYSIKGPKDKYSRRFSALFYTRVLED
jgi:hypothetical protein